MGDDKCDPGGPIESEMELEGERRPAESMEPMELERPPGVGTNDETPRLLFGEEPGWPRRVGRAGCGGGLPGGGGGRPRAARSVPRGEASGGACAADARPLGKPSGGGVGEDPSMSGE